MEQLQQKRRQKQKQVTISPTISAKRLNKKQQHNDKFKQINLKRQNHSKSTTANSINNNNNLSRMSPNSLKIHAKTFKQVTDTSPKEMGLIKGAKMSKNTVSGRVQEVQHSANLSGLFMHGIETNQKYIKRPLPSSNSKSITGNSPSKLNQSYDSPLLLNNQNINTTFANQYSEKQRRQEELIHEALKEVAKVQKIDLIQRNQQSQLANIQSAYSNSYNNINKVPKVSQANKKINARESLANSNYPTYKKSKNSRASPDLADAGIGAIFPSLQIRQQHQNESQANQNNSPGLKHDDDDDAEEDEKKYLQEQKLQLKQHQHISQAASSCSGDNSSVQLGPSLSVTHKNISKLTRNTRKATSVINSSNRKLSPSSTNKYKKSSKVNQISSSSRNILKHTSPSSIQPIKKQNTSSMHIKGNRKSLLDYQESTKANQILKQRAKIQKKSQNLGLLQIKAIERRQQEEDSINQRVDERKAYN